LIQYMEGFSDNFGYRGEYHDPESGYIYLRMRYLDPKTGSFTTEDPIRDGLNWFSYCGGNPVKFTDPWGTLREGYADDNGVYHTDPDAEEFGEDSITCRFLFK